MESYDTDILRESLSFTARKARLPNAQESSSNPAVSYSEPASSSSRYYSTRIHTMMERMSKLDLSGVDAETKASKGHCTEVMSDYHSAVDSFSAVDSSTSESESWSGTEGASELDLELFEENLEAIRRFQSEDPAGNFFQYGYGEYVLGTKIGEGGKAEIYKATEFTRLDGEKVALPVPVVVKVFKARYSLLDLQTQ